MDPQPKIVVVDDTPLNIRLLEAVLAPRNYTVLPATSGRDALELIGRERPDLILLDILMPEMDGYEVCRRLRNDPATRALPVVMITASGDQEKLKALEAGADDFIAKPFDKAELLARVGSLAGTRHRGARPPPQRRGRHDEAGRPAPRGDVQEVGDHRRGGGFGAGYAPASLHVRLPVPLSSAGRGFFS